MKLTTLLTSLFFTFNVFAVELIDTYYSPKYEIISVKPICPTTTGGIRCMAIGTIVKIKSTLNGCLDRVDFFNSQVLSNKGEAKIFITSVAKNDKKNAVVRCIKLPEDYKTISLPGENYSTIDLNSLTIEN